MKVVLFNLDQPDVKVTLAKAADAKDARRIMKLFCKAPGWKIDRRPDLHTWDNLAITFEKGVTHD